MNPWAELSGPRGGELSEWASIAAIPAALAGIALIVAGLVRMRRVGLDPTAKWIFLLGLGLLPAFALISGTGAVMAAAKKPQNCMTCHVMEPYGRDMQDPKSQGLAAAHFRNRWIGEHQCYECHSHYGVFGTIEAKAAGVGHLYHYLTGTYEQPIKMRAPYPIDQCLKCHGTSDAFLKIKKHVDPNVVADLKSAKISCIECHEPPHPKEKK